MKHKLYDRYDGLDHCMVCGGAEASLPTHCPGRKMNSEESDAVYDGKLNYVVGPASVGWWKFIGDKP